ncbi:MAG: hypothetical protein KAW14_14590 [Candidatus Aegiribacteria sp.]|nr:hypothetical protein [Candidatus Aegiribacteria sp.]
MGVGRFDDEFVMLTMKSNMITDGWPPDSVLIRTYEPNSGNTEIIATDGNSAIFFDQFISNDIISVARANNFLLLINTLNGEPFAVELPIPSSGSSYSSGWMVLTPTEHGVLMYNWHISSFVHIGANGELPDFSRYL